MTNNVLSRREFLKLCGLSLGTLAFNPLFPRDEREYAIGVIGRVTHDISVFDEPKLEAETVGYRSRDDLLNIYYQVTPLTGPAYNPVWYRVWGGYVHSAFVQRMEVRFNETLDTISEEGQLSEITIPYSRPYDYSSTGEWEIKSDFLLYYGSNHWVTDIVEGPDRQAWYEISDELWEGFKYYVPASHLRAIPDEELTPISPNVAFEDKRIEVSKATQTLIAYEEGEIVMQTQVSTGINRGGSTEGYPTITPSGVHNIASKMPSKHMGSGGLAGTGEDFSALPGVPWTAFFAEGGYAIHGTFWHNNFGIQMSRGCINMRNEDAKWLFRWMLPIHPPSSWETRGFGTQLIVT